MSDYWQLWLDKKDHVQGVAIVYRCADKALKLMPDGRNERDRREWLEDLCKVLNYAEGRREI